MLTEEAMECLAYLEAAYRTRLEATTVAIYVAELEGQRLTDVREACRWITRSNRFFPSVAELLDEVETAARLRRELATKGSLPAKVRWTENDWEEAASLAREVLSDWRKRHPDRPAPPLLMPDRQPADDGPVAFDAAEVAAKRRAARTAREAIEKGVADAIPSP